MKTSLDVLISRSTQGWKNNLSSRTFRAVPMDALIFQFCEDGNLEGVKTLLARGDASLMDRCPKGLTLLHVSITPTNFIKKRRVSSTSYYLFETPIIIGGFFFSLAVSEPFSCSSPTHKASYKTFAFINELIASTGGNVLQSILSL